MNFGLFPMLKRYKEFKHDWEPAMLEGSPDLVFRNSFKDIRCALETLNETGARYEFECCDTSHSITSIIFGLRGWRRHRTSSKPAAVCWAGSARIRRRCCT
jgi:uncharacterized protein (DUF849 family)